MDMDVNAKFHIDGKRHCRYVRVAVCALLHYVYIPASRPSSASAAEFLSVKHLVIGETIIIINRFV